jgi:predicted DNA-binding antitoxin AbrB/MazE fold protein
MKKDAHGHWIEEIDESSCNCECTECEHGGYCEDSHFPEEYEDENDEDIQTPKHKVDDYTIDNVYAAVKDLIDNDGLTPGTKLTITISQCGEDEDDGDEDDKFINEAQEALSKIRLKDGEEVSLRVHKDADAEKVDVIEEDDKSEAVDVIEDETESTDNN